MSLKALVLILSITVIVSLNLGLAEKPVHQKDLYFPSLSLKYLTLGYNDTMADLYWLRLIQDIENCGKKNEKDGSSANPGGRHMGRNRVPACSMGWGYHMLDLITDLTPRFHAPASMGPLTLSVVTDDIDGATLIFEKSMKNFPEDWVIFYQAGYHFQFELENEKRAADLYQIATRAPQSPLWLPLLVARLHTNMGEIEIAKHILLRYRKKVLDNPALLKRTDDKLSALKKKRAKE